MFLAMVGVLANHPHNSAVGVSANRHPEICVQLRRNESRLHGVVGEDANGETPWSGWRGRQPRQTTRKDANHGTSDSRQIFVAFHLPRRKTMIAMTARVDSEMEMAQYTPSGPQAKVRAKR